MNRRNLLAGVAGAITLPPAGVASSTVRTLDGGSVTQPTASIDADLVRICAEHVVNMEAYNRDGGMLSAGEPDPLWTAYAQTREAISAAKPRTLQGMLAKARAAKAEARQPDGTHDPEGSPAEEWAWDLVNDLLAGRAGA